LCGFASALLASFYLMLAHGRAVSVLRANCPDTPVGIVLNPTPIYPASPSTYDRGLTRYIDGEVNRWFLDPLAGRGYPEDIIRAKTWSWTSSSLVTWMRFLLPSITWG
jgi:beta-glucosidase